ncbi:MAG: hypothetical protein IJV77_03475 [Clostridia bacterium]|nr:hypothetical protein [Clostridia bacterium]
MLAKIKGKEKIYYSAVFATNRDQVVVFDETCQKLVCIDKWDKKWSLNVMTVNFDCTDWKINTDNFKCLWDCKNIFKIVKQQNYSSQMLEEAKNIQQQIKPTEWNKIKNQNDAIAFINEVGDLHDAHLVFMKNYGDCVELFFDTTWRQYVKMRFFKPTTNTLCEGDVYFEASLYVDENHVEMQLSDIGYLCDITLTAENVQFDLLFEEKSVIKNCTFDFSFDNKDKQFFVDVDNLVKDSSSPEKNVIGTCAKENPNCVYLFYQNCVHKFQLDFFANKNNRLNDEFVKKIDILKHALKQKGLFLYEYGVEQRPQPKLLFKEKISKFSVYSFKYLAIPLLLNVLIWLIVQLANPQMKWYIFFIMGIGISVISFLIFIMVVLFNRIDACIYVYETHIFCPTGIISINTLTHATIDSKSITLFLADKSKRKLPKCKNNQLLFNIIKEQIKDFGKKENSMRQQ